MDLPLRRKDTNEEVQIQWEGLMTFFNTQNCTLLFHLKNHYAIVFAIRSWVTPEGKVVRECLTARKGQRPSVWLDFLEMRETMLSWSGYKMMVVARKTL